MKRTFILIALIALSLSIYGCGGGGSGSANLPGGENPGLPSVVQLMPAQFIAQTNGFITFSAKVLDGNGKPISNQTVTFTNLSSIGFLQATTAITDSTGIARVNLSSTTPGFSTVLAQVYIGAGQVRDQRTVFFTPNNILAVSMLLDADGDNDGIFDELSDLTLGENLNDTSVKIRARVYNAGGVQLAGSSVSFYAERPFRVGTPFVGTDPTPEKPTYPLCSDNSKTCFIAFPLGTTAVTSEFGEAIVQVVVGAESLRNFTTNLNIFANADNGAYNMKTLFISPVSVSSITVTANPRVIPPATSQTEPKINPDSEITATAITNFNLPVPDGTVINFTASCGTIDPFGRTINGAVKVRFFAPAAEGVCTVTASVGTISATVDVIVTTSLTVFPTAMTLDEGAIGTFNIFGGVKPYTVISSNSHVTVSAITNTPTGGTFTVTIGSGFCTPVAPATTCTGTATILVRDAVGTSVTITLTINGT